VPGQAPRRSNSRMAAARVWPPRGTTPLHHSFIEGGFQGGGPNPSGGGAPPWREWSHPSATSSSSLLEVEARTALGLEGQTSISRKDSASVGNPRSSDQSLMALSVIPSMEASARSSFCGDRFLSPCSGNSRGNHRSGCPRSDDGGVRRRSPTCGRHFWS
jgi:hypothetical protein